ncbi:MAG: hypothetical protein CMP11_06045 [Zetaproteobacteria bacterium]|nr:hypothetical protein [Pseudobdellovibrionaceae bacterium]|tara:strand:+ start:870 stop:1679 length:810 start_codon:yes stop_codon:yes gene_type:complete
MKNYIFVIFIIYNHLSHSSELLPPIVQLQEFDFPFDKEDESLKKCILENDLQNLIKNLSNKNFNTDLLTTKDKLGRTLLHFAVLETKEPLVIQTLIQKGINTREEDNYGMTALHLALYQGKESIALVLTKSHAQKLYKYIETDLVNRKDTRSAELFNAKVRNDNEEEKKIIKKHAVEKRLSSYNSDSNYIFFFDKVDKYGQSPISIAEKKCPKTYDILTRIKSMDLNFDYFTSKPFKYIEEAQQSYAQNNRRTQGCFQNNWMLCFLICQ